MHGQDFFTLHDGNYKLDTPRNAVKRYVVIIVIDDADRNLADRLVTDEVAHLVSGPEVLIHKRTALVRVALDRNAREEV